MTITPDRVPMITSADTMPGPGQGRWTYQDYAALPDDGQRYEIIDGVLFMTPSPNRWHQEIVGEFFVYLHNYIKVTGIGRVYMAPFDVELAPNVVVQPDVMVILNDSLDKITDNRVVGAPNLVVEVASPGTAGHDRRGKQDAYARAGVPEYWIADPAAHTVEVLVLETGTYQALGVFRDKAILPSRVLPAFPIHVERFFV